jgi:hypothetical protein
MTALSPGTIVLADERGKLEVQHFERPDGSAVMLTFTVPVTIPLALNSREARLIAASLLDYADQKDMRDGITVPIPKVELP